LSKPYELRVLEYLKNYLDVAKKVKKLVQSLDPDAKVYVFGSVARGKFTAASDIDILVITNKPQLKYEMMVHVYKELEAPIELHITTPKGFEKWYKRFLKPEELIEV